jgi:hypothetical protein
MGCTASLLCIVIIVFAKFIQNLIPEMIFVDGCELGLV